MHFLLKKWRPILFVFYLLFMVAVNLILVRTVPLEAPCGAPDETMHRSMAEYISRHLSWPRWDSDELVRWDNGVSYATGSAIIYWLHGLLFRLTGAHRIASVLLFWGFLAFLIRIYRSQPRAGLLGLVCIVPQVVFVFSYVNTDVQTVLISFFLGWMSASVLENPSSGKAFTLFVVLCAFCITARHHMWFFGFLVFIPIAVMNSKIWRQLSPKRIAVTLIFSLIVAAWWPLTSYVANNGDLIGFSASAKAVEQFNPDPGLKWSRSFYEINWIQFVRYSVKSFYGVWGYMNVSIRSYLHAYIGLIALFLFLIRAGHARERIAFGALFIFDFLLLAIRAVTVDYQYQGRYYFPAFYIFIGIMLWLIAHGYRCVEEKEGRQLDYLSVFLVGVHAISMVLLLTRLDFLMHSL